MSGIFVEIKIKKVLTVQFSKMKNNKKTAHKAFFKWQGQKDLNPRHMVLETIALPTELYPYIMRHMIITKVKKNVK